MISHIFTDVSYISWVDVKSAVDLYCLYKLKYSEKIIIRLFLDKSCFNTWHWVTLPLLKLPSTMVCHVYTCGSAQAESGCWSQVAKSTCRWRKIWISPVAISRYSASNESILPPGSKIHFLPMRIHPRICKCKRASS